MAFFYSSNYQEDTDISQYYQSYSYDASYEPRYVDQYYNHTQYYGSSYQLSPAPSLVGYHYSAYSQPDFLGASKNANVSEYGDYFHDHVSTQYVISYSTAGAVENDLDFEEYDPDPYDGGYDIEKTYGKALPPSDELCYPPTKIGPTVPANLGGDLKSVSSPYGQEGQNVENVAMPKATNEVIAGNVVQVEKPNDLETDDEDDDGEEDEDEDEYEDEDEDGDEEQQEEEKRGKLQNVEGGVIPTNGSIASQVVQERNESESKLDDEEEEEEEVEEEKRGDDQESYGKEIRRQIPPGYGLEAMDFCEGVFGGYFPCLRNRNKGSYDQSGSTERVHDYYDSLQGTVDYLFGNPNPYGGAMPERGSTGDPIYSYQRHYPQQAISGEVQYGENASWVHTARYYYGHNGE